MPPQTLRVVFLNKFCRFSILRAHRSTKDCLEPRVGESAGQDNHLVILGQVPVHHTPLGALVLTQKKLFECPVLSSQGLSNSGK